MSHHPSDPTRTWADPNAQGAEPAPLVVGDRYEDLGLIAAGGMGEVRRVHDRLLDCHVAMKLLAADRADSDKARARFIAEAAATAKLSHPGIVAVHDRGERDDGRLWYTMTEVRGDTLSDLLTHRTETGGSTTRRLVGVLVQVCNAVGYAHSQGVVHRDLKPDNLMVGPFGEVLVMDWGIAAEAGAPGDRAGTRTWSAPEQLHGDSPAPTADVWSLGQITGLAVGHADPALDAIVARATHEDPAERPANAAELGRALQDWLDGAARRAEADRILAEALAHRPRIEALRTEEITLRSQAKALLDAVSADDPVEDKEPAWELEDQAADRARQAAVLEATWLQQVGAVLERDAHHPGAHAALADHHAAMLIRAEGERRHHDALAHEVHLRRHDRGSHAALLRGHGALTLVTDPPGARVRLFRFVERKRRLVPVFERELGTTPLVEVSLERGSWLLELTAPGHQTVRYPVFLGRGESWDGIAPGGTEPFPIPLPLDGELAADDCYVPAGWFWCGGDPEAIEAFPRARVWVDGFVAKRFPVTVAAYTRFLQEVARQDADRARALAPRPPPGGEPRPSDHPITGINWYAAEACAAALGGRLPHGLEWEKAARGVDRRTYLTGDHVEPAWFNTLDGASRTAEVGPVGAQPTDRSVYGISDLGGNCSEWCQDGWQVQAPERVPGPAQPGEFRIVRGGSYRHGGTALRCASRQADPPHRSFHSLGFRVVRSWPDQDP